MIEIKGENVVPYTLGDNILKQLRFQDKHRNRVALMVSERAMMFCSLQPLLMQYWITAGVGYGLTKQIGHVVSSLYVR
jgi:hypothetical protein